MAESNFRKCYKWTGNGNPMPIDPSYCSKSCTRCIWLGLDCEGKPDFQPLFKPRMQRHCNLSDHIRQLLSQAGKDSWDAKSEIKKSLTIKNLTQARKEAWANMLPMEKMEICQSISQAQKRKWENMTEAEKVEKTRRLVQGRKRCWEEKSESEKRRIIENLIRKRPSRALVICKICGEKVYEERAKHLQEKHSLELNFHWKYCDFYLSETP